MLGLLVEKYGMVLEYVLLLESFLLQTIHILSAKKSLPMQKCLVPKTVAELF